MRSRGLTTMEPNAYNPTVSSAIHKPRVKCASPGALFYVPFTSALRQRLRTASTGVRRPARGLTGKNAALLPAIGTLLLLRKDIAPPLFEAAAARGKPGPLSIRGVDNNL